MGNIGFSVLKQLDKLKSDLRVIAIDSELPDYLEDYLNQYVNGTL